MNKKQEEMIKKCRDWLDRTQGEGNNLVKDKVN